MTWSQVIFVYAMGVLLGWASHDLVNAGLRWLIRKSRIRCKLHLCGGRVTSSQYGIGWQCATCGAIKHWESWKNTPVGRERESGRR